MNNVTLIGRLTKDPELRYVAGSGNAVSQFTLAVDKGLSRDKRQQFESQGKPTADFIRIVVWGKQAENCANYLKKGLKVAVQGSIRTSSYQSQSGEMRYSTDVVASNVEFLEWSDSNNNQNDNRYNRPEPSAPAARSNSGLNDFSSDFLAVEDDDDIPF